MENEFKCNVIRNGHIEDLVLTEISKNEREGKKLIGKALGINLNHCVYLGVRHGKDFLEKAKYYFTSNKTDKDLEEMRRSQPSAILVEFYGERGKIE